MKPKKVPSRMCVGCRTMKPKGELLRVVRSTDGIAKVDYSQKANGRGAYICKDIACLEKAIKIRALSRALEVEISEEVLANLRKELKGIDE